MGLFVADTSALIAVLANEPEALSFMQEMDAYLFVVSAATLHEAFCVAQREELQNGASRLQKMIEVAEPEVVAFDAVQLAQSRAAYARYGHRTGHPAKLNMGDCFAYALAKTRNLPLLFKGDDFVHTDIVPALKVA